LSPGQPPFSPIVLQGLVDMHPDEVGGSSDQFQVGGRYVRHGVAHQPAQAGHDGRRVSVEQHLEGHKLDDIRFVGWNYLDFFTRQNFGPVL
jgi:hypothetical protein